MPYGESTGLVFPLQQAECILPADTQGTMHCKIPLEISDSISAYYAQGYTESSAVYSVCMQDSEALSVNIRHGLPSILYDAQRNMEGKSP